MHIGRFGLGVATMALLSLLSQGQPATALEQTGIAELLVNFQKAILTTAPADQFFSPEVRAAKRAEIERLSSKGFTKFEITNYSLKDLYFEDPQHATLAATIRWSTRNEEASKTTTLRFTKDQGHWYFANVDFWEVSLAWFFPLILYGICYGTGLTVMYWHSGRQHWPTTRRKLLWQLLAFLPFSLPLYFAKKPWATS
jgi:hypothetical protein